MNRRVCRQKGDPRSIPTGIADPVFRRQKRCRQKRLDWRTCDECSEFRTISHGRSSGETVQLGQS